MASSFRITTLMTGDVTQYAFGVITYGISNFIKIRPETIVTKFAHADITEIKFKLGEVRLGY